MFCASFFLHHFLLPLDFLFIMLSTIFFSSIFLGFKGKISFHIFISWIVLWVGEITASILANELLGLVSFGVLPSDGYGYVRHIRYAQPKQQTKIYEIKERQKNYIIPISNRMKI